MMVTVLVAALAYGPHSSVAQVKEAVEVRVVRLIEQFARNVNCGDKIPPFCRGDDCCSGLDRCEQANERFAGLKEKPIQRASAYVAYLEDHQPQRACAKKVYSGNWSQFVDNVYEIACSHPDPDPKYVELNKGCTNDSIRTKVKKGD
jgi:hypothetical protein